MPRSPDFRARVVAFTRGDYTADLEIEVRAPDLGPGCAGLLPGRPRRGRLAASRGQPPRPGLRAAERDPQHDDRADHLPAERRGVGLLARRLEQLRPPGPAGRAGDLAHSPASQPDPSCPEALVVAGISDQRRLLDEQWFGRGGRTSGGIVAVMEARPASRSRRAPGSARRSPLGQQLRHQECPEPLHHGPCARVRGRDPARAQDARDRPDRALEPAGRNRQEQLSGLSLRRRWRRPAGRREPARHRAPAPAWSAAARAMRAAGGAQQVTYGPFADHLHVHARPLSARRLRSSMGPRST